MFDMRKEVFKRQSSFRGWDIFILFNGNALRRQCDGSRKALALET